MFYLVLTATILSFSATSVLSMMAIYSHNDRYQLSARIMFPVSVASFLLLGFLRFHNSDLSKYINITSTIWSFFYKFCFILLVVLIYLFFTKWKAYWKPFVSIIFPFIAVILIISIPFVNSPRKISIDETGSVFATHILPVHILFAIVGELFFFLSFVGSILYLVMEWQLRKKSSMRLIYKLPNLETIEKFNSWAITRSFILLSLGIVLGIVMTSSSFNSLFMGTAKEMHIYFSWLIILGIFIVRKIKKIVSHKVNLINAVLFVVIMFLFVFTNIYITKGFHGFK